MPTLADNTPTASGGPPIRSTLTPSLPGNTDKPNRGNVNKYPNDNPIQSAKKEYQH